MKTDFSINVRVALDVTPELVSLVTAILASNQPQSMGIPLSPLANQHEEAPKTEAKSESEQVPSETSKGTARTEPKSESEQVPSETSKGAAKKKLTTEYIREAMHKARQRIEGEDYKNNVDGEQYKKYHKRLTAQFKQIATLLGKDKPSELDTEEARQSFIDQCNELQILDDGSIGVVAPY